MEQLNVNSMTEYPENQEIWWGEESSSERTPLPQPATEDESAELNGQNSETVACETDAPKPWESTPEDLNPQAEAAPAQHPQEEEARPRLGSAVRLVQKNLALKLHELESVLGATDELVRNDDDALRTLHTAIDFSIDRVTRLESMIRQLQSTALENMRHTQEIEESQAVLEAARRQSEESLQASAVEKIRESFDAQVRELDSALKVKDRLLEKREAELKQKELLIKAREEDMVKLSERLSAEIQKLTVELTAKKVALASYETSHWRSVGRRNVWAKRLTLGGLLRSRSSEAPDSPNPQGQKEHFAPIALRQEPVRKPLDRHPIADSKQEPSEPEKSAPKKVIHL